MYAGQKQKHEVLSITAPPDVSIPPSVVLQSSDT
jgi:hypothetical protein